MKRSLRSSASVCGRSSAVAGGRRSPRPWSVAGVGAGSRCAEPLGSGRQGNVAASIFLAKNLLGYRDVLSSKHSGPGGGPIPIDARPDLSRLSDDELDQLKALMDKAQPRSAKL